MLLLLKSSRKSRQQSVSERERHASGSFRGTAQKLYLIKMVFEGLAPEMLPASVRSIHIRSIYREEVDAQVRAVIAQLGERQTEDLKVPGSIPGHGICTAQENAFEVTND